MEQNDELQGCVFAVPSKTPWITSKPLVHKKNQHSEEYLRMKRIFRENDFSVYTDPETGEIVCKVIPKDMDAEQKKADWILNGGIEKEWDSYLDKMEKYGLSDYLAIKQKYFDQYQKSLSEENK